MPLEVRCYEGPNERQAGSPTWGWSAESFDRVGEHHLPKKSVEVVYSRPVGKHVGGEQPRETTRKIEVTEVAFDRTFPKSVFWPKFEPGAAVWDQFSKKAYTVPGEALPRGPSGGTAVPLRVMEPTSWSANLSTAGVMLGGLLLAVGLLLKYKQGRTIFGKN